MTVKRFSVNDLVKYNYSEIGEYIDENHTDRPLRNDELVKLLNELHEENEELKQELQQYKDEHKKWIEECEELHKDFEKDWKRWGRM